MGFYNTGNFDNSCYKCTKRQPHCHSTCPDYAKAVEKGKDLNKAIIKAKGYEYQAYATDLYSKLLRERC